MPSIVIVLPILIHFIIRRTLWDRFYHHLPFTGEKTEAQNSPRITQWLNSRAVVQVVLHWLSSTVFFTETTVPSLRENLAKLPHNRFTWAHTTYCAHKTQFKNPLLNDHPQIFLLPIPNSHLEIIYELLCDFLLLKVFISEVLGFNCVYDLLAQWNCRLLKVRAF